MMPPDPKTLASGGLATAGNSWLPPSPATPASPTSGAELLDVLAESDAATSAAERSARLAGQVIDCCDAVLAAAEGQQWVALAQTLLELGAARVAVTRCGTGDRNRLEALLPPLPDAEVDLLAAADEAELQGQPIAWPVASRLDRPAKRALQVAAARLGAEQLLAIPLKSRRSDTEAQAVLLLADPPHEAAQLAALLSPTLGLTIATRERADSTWWQRLREGAKSALRADRRRKIVGAVAATAAILSCPWPYAADCDCQLEPALRRFVAAPFEGRLETVEVHPGDVVAAGQVLARMDNREIAFELAGLEAERDQAHREQTAALARRDVTASQLARLEGERVSARIEVLEARQRRLAIVAPIAGIVVEGDLDRVRGMPLETGRTLFEIAPLDRVVCEVEVPEYDFAEVTVGQHVEITLDAQPWHTLRGTIGRLRPRVEERQDRPAFIAEVELENPAALDGWTPNRDAAGQSLAARAVPPSGETSTDEIARVAARVGWMRPGMTGEAAVQTRWRPLAWNWFHRWYGQFRRGW